MNGPRNAREAIDLAPHRLLFWPRGCGLTLADAPPIGDVIFLSRPPPVAARFVAAVAKAVQVELRKGSTVLVLAMDAAVRDAVKREILRRGGMRSQPSAESPR